MFILKLYDRIGNELSEGDIVKISNGREMTFYAEVKYLEEEQAIAPFHTFSFHSVEKVDSVPEDAELSSETRYKIWYKYPYFEPDENSEIGEKYLIDWVACEHNLNNKMFRIQRHG